MTISFSRIVKFCALILLNMFSMPLACILCMPVIHWFSLLMVSQISCMLYLYFFRFSSVASPVCSNIASMSQAFISVFNLIQSTGETLIYCFYLTYWALYFHNFSFKFYCFGVSISVLNSSFMCCIVVFISFSSLFFFF
jgi:hypothetical protein